VKSQEIPARAAASVPYAVTSTEDVTLPFMLMGAPCLRIPKLGTICRRKVPRMDVLSGNGTEKSAIPSTLGAQKGRRGHCRTAVQLQILQQCRSSDGVSMDCTDILLLTFRPFRTGACTGGTDVLQQHQIRYYDPSQ